MSVAEPDDVNEIFRRMTENLNLDPVELTATTVSSLTDLELLDAYAELREELLERGEMLYPRTDSGRDMQTQLQAYNIEMRKRGLK